MFFVVFHVVDSFLYGWPRFLSPGHILIDPAGGTVEAQLVIQAAPTELCCMWDLLGIPMNFFFFFLVSAQTRNSSLAPSFPRHLSLVSSPLHLHIHLLLSFSVPICLCVSLCLTVFAAVWSVDCAKQQVWAAPSFVTTEGKKKNIFYWCCSLLSFFASLSLVICFFGLPTNVVSAVLKASSVCFFFFPQLSPLLFLFL